MGFDEWVDEDGFGDECGEGWGWIVEDVEVVGIGLVFVQLVVFGPGVFDV